LIRRRSLRDEVVDHIREAIAEGRFSKGDRLRIGELARELGVSPTPIREALNYLCAVGLVELVPRKGFLVKGLSRKELEDTLEVRICLERMAVRLFVERASEEHLRRLEELYGRMRRASELEDLKLSMALNEAFHSAVVEGSGNGVLLEVVKGISDKLGLVRFLSISRSGRIKESLAEHGEILEALRARDARRAEELVDAHIRKVREMVLSTHL